MVFSSMTFIWVFLPILLLIYFLIKDKYKNYILLIFSLIFYAWGEPRYIVLMIFSIIINYILGILIDRIKIKKIKKIIFILTLLINIGLLGYYKYFSFFISNINSIFKLSITSRNIVLPIGISFYTFQIMSYIIDLYKGDIKVQKNIFKLALYISFFPQLIAGPIVKYKDIDDQIDNREYSLDMFVDGTKRFIYGLSKKVLIANTMASIADLIFNSNISNITTLLAWIGSIAYTLQIYYDFSGYSDMAIGLGKMFGFTFMENFNQPYKSGSITEFWQRWHISLSTWFKEYIYIPLGGNRKGKLRTYINLWIIFLITGIWHGAAWSFIAWGLFHGFFIFIERIGIKNKLDRLKILNHLYTLLIVNFGWVLFRSDGLSFALKFIKKMIVPTNFVSSIRLYKIFTLHNIIVFIFAILFCCIIQIIYNKIKENRNIKKMTYILNPIFIIIMWSLCIASLVSNTYNPFIYFRF